MSKLESVFTPFLTLLNPSGRGPEELFASPYRAAAGTTARAYPPVTRWRGRPGNDERFGRRCKDMGGNTQRRAEGALIGGWSARKIIHEAFTVIEGLDGGDLYLAVRSSPSSFKFCF